MTSTGYFLGFTKMREAKPIFYAIDLFAGCGGLSEGFKQAGFNIIAQVEMDRWACESLRTRHLYYGLKEIGKGYLYQRYIREQVRREDILDRFPDLGESISHRVIQATLGNDGTKPILEKIEASRSYHGAPRFHVLLGGPPCQPYSLAGRSRDPFRMENDERHYLYKHYLEILESLQPDFFFMRMSPVFLLQGLKGKRYFAEYWMISHLWTPLTKLLLLWNRFSKSRAVISLTVQTSTSHKAGKDCFLLDIRNLLKAKVRG